jgi:hypothetical protein
MHTTTRVAAWTLITPERRQLAYRYLEVMYQMNRPVYASEPAEVVAPRMLRRRHEFYHCEGAGFEAVVGFRWYRRRHQYELKSLGFTGQITPADALELIVAKIAEFIRRHQLQRIFAVRPFAMESQAVLQLYELAMHHPALDIRGNHRLATGTFIWIRLSQNEVKDSTPGLRAAASH